MAGSLVLGISTLSPENCCARHQILVLERLPDHTENAGVGVFQYVEPSRFVSSNKLMHVAIQVLHSHLVVSAGVDGNAPE